jgi:uncharacterized protein (DUF849 family)
MYSLAYFVDKGLATPPLLVQGVFGILARAEQRRQVAKIRAVVEDLGKEITTPAEARAMLALRGAHSQKGLS